ncbi:hypothetical protein IGK95_001556 [Enterococcus sp. DIV1555a]
MKLKQPFHKVYQNVLITTENEVWAYFTCPSEYVIGQNKKYKKNINGSGASFFKVCGVLKILSYFLIPIRIILMSDYLLFLKALMNKLKTWGMP